MMRRTAPTQSSALRQQSAFVGEGGEKESSYPRMENHQRHMRVCGFTAEASCDRGLQLENKGL